MTARDDLPALLGGEPAFPDGPPTWPIADDGVARVLRELAASGDWGKYHGPHSLRLAEWIAKHHATEFVELCASGTCAIELALRGVGVGAGDEVLLAGYDFKGNFVNVVRLGALPVLIDLDPETWNLDPTLLAAAITERTRAIVVSHLHGGTVSMKQVRAVADEHSLAIVEDACQMPGATIEGRPAGIWGDIGAWSFGGSKTLSAGRGGALYTRDAAIAQRIRLDVERGNHAYPLSELQAAVLLPQLERLEDDHQRRAANVERLLDGLTDVKGLRPITRPTEETKPGYYKLGFQYEREAFEGLSRENFVRAARGEGVAFDEGFRSLHKIHSRRRYRAGGALTQADAADERMIVLHHPVLLAEGDVIDRVAWAIGKVSRHAASLAARADRD
ncbi:L-glutamine:2-deoxy-scyllo-inosose aminotransferase [Planctomycetes bacterium Pan216]|uniref:L-glutamine:2-deoxy-scyllo-inosose aminotransferase n=1 Tax=Kolteria novifilia TaxID=2527975 RepID=A0A518AXU2_9BACT|nr:L-glutamine:2-deoxy-scyllo-inosose aminotransferase [Planctomycetes bacterium Pan216]